MRILVGMMHPKHVWMFKNFILEMMERGHEIEIVAIEKDLTVTLLEKFGLPFNLIGKNPASTSGKLFALPLWTYRTYKIAQRFKPDIFIGQALPHFAYVSAFQKKPYIIFEDSEPAHVVQAITFPLASNIITPSCYRESIGRKQIKFNGYFELAYLHPNHFSPSESVLEEAGIKEGELFVVVRFVSWKAVHDIGQEGGFDQEKKRELIRKLSKHCHVVISSESPLPLDLMEYRISLSPENIHHLLYYATLVIGDSQTMTTEAGILGTPAIRSNSFVGQNDMGNFIELDQTYGLIFNFRDPDMAIEKAIELIHDKNLKEKWKEKRDYLVREKGNCAQFMVEFIERYE